MATNRLKKTTDKDGNTVYVRPRKKPKSTPIDKPRAVAAALRTPEQLDGRVKLARDLKSRLAEIESGPDQFAAAMLLRDLAAADVVAEASLAVALEGPEKMLSGDGKPSRALCSWERFLKLKRDTLAALQRYQYQVAKPPGDPDLGDLIMATDADDEPNEN